MPVQVIMRNRRLLAGVAWAIATVCLIVFIATFDVRTALQQIGRAKIHWIAIAIAANFLMLPLLTEQWSRLLPKSRPMRWSVLWECVTVGIAAMNTLPFGSGHAVAVGVLSRRSPGGLSGAVSLLALEQICEGVAKLALLLAALAVAPLPESLKAIPWIVAAAVIAGLVALIWIANHPRDAAAQNGWRAKWSAHLEVVRRPQVFVAAAGMSILMKLCELCAIYAVQRSLGVDLPFVTAPLILAVVTFASTISVTPGNLGVYETAAFGVYRVLGVPPNEAIALGLVQHFCFLLPIVGTGYLLTAWRAVVPTRLLAAEVPGPTK